MPLMNWIAQNMPWSPIAQRMGAAQDAEFMRKYRQSLMDQQNAQLQQQQQAQTAAKAAWADNGTWQPNALPVTPRRDDPNWAQANFDMQNTPVGTGTPSLLESVPQEQRPIWEAYAQSDPVGSLQRLGQMQTGQPQEKFETFAPGQHPYGADYVGQRNLQTNQITATQPRAASALSDGRTVAQKDAEALGLKPGTEEWNNYIRQRTLPSQPSQQTRNAGSALLPNGDMVFTEFMPDKGFGYRGGDGQWTPLPPGARPATPSMGGYLTPKDFLAKRNELLQEQQALQRLNAYGKSVGNMETGIKNWASSVTAKFRTALGSKELNPAEFARMTGEGQLQALLGLFRTDVVGPGVMTEFDAQRVLQALGGNIGMLQNPQVVERLLHDLYRDKLERTKLLEMEINRNAPVFNAPPMQITAPDEFGGTGAPPAPDGGADDQPPPDVPPEVWNEMTPEQKALWR